MNSLKQTITKALAVIAVLIVGCMTASADTVTEGFDDYTLTSGLPSGWNFSGTDGVIVRETETYYTKAPCVSVPQVNTDTYLITPELTGDFSFWLRNQTKNYQASITAYACTYADGVMTLGAQIGTKTLAKTSGSKPSWEQVTFSSQTGTRVALLISRGHFDDFTYTPYQASAEATLTIADYASGSSFDFGTVAAGTTKTFSLWNGGLADLTISAISVTGDFTITAGADLTTVASKSTAEVTIATPAKDAEGVLTITSSDANSPYTISLKSTYKVPAPIMGVDPTKVDFGRVSADASQTITISNTGDAELTTSILSDNDDFSVSKAAINVAVGQSETFTITYHYNAEAYGGHAATIFISSNASDTPTTIAVSASVKDPNAWSEDFSAGVLPDGWEVDGSAASWTFENGEAKGKYEGAGHWLLTPQLIVKAGESLTFQAKANQAFTDLVVQYQKDGGAWTTKLSQDISSIRDNYETFTISGLEAGTYRFRIATENLCLDNFEGFQLVGSSAVKETWWVSYVFSYKVDGVDYSEVDTETMEVKIDDDRIYFKFPEPITGGTWMQGTVDADGCLVFPSGQYIGSYGGYKTYFCGADAEQNLLDNMVFIPNDDGDSYFCTSVLVNTSTTAFNPFGIFSNVVVSKTEPVDGIGATLNDKAKMTNDHVYDLQGRRVVNPRKGLYIVNGRTVVIK